MLDLSRSGEHKPAVDTARDLLGSDDTCSQSVLDGLEFSRSRLDKADAYTRRALRQRKEGDLLGARANFRRALGVYPRYYWVQKLLHDLDRSIDIEGTSLRNEASYFEDRGDLEKTLERLVAAARLRPEDGSIEEEIRRIRAAMERSQEESEIRERIQRARMLMEEGRFEEAEGHLAGEGIPEEFRQQREEILFQVRERRVAVMDQRMAVVREAEQKGNVDLAASHLKFVLTMSRPGDPGRTEMVEYARLLGLKLFSDGQLTRARELWNQALGCDPGNRRLEKYLQEVTSRLESLERFRREEIDRIAR
ncbi:MAG: hypothetical protein JSV00_07220 [bacterium]|nr:MAG: hypothetical protein JSV00_07220 [bacterium]